MFSFVPSAAEGAHFQYVLVNDSFQQQWLFPRYWTLVSGEDDGANGYPDGTDTFSMDRTSLGGNGTRLAIEGGPPFEVAAISGVGTGNQDIVFKFGDFTLGDLEVLASAEPFNIRSERDKDLTITGVISGEGDLLLTRSGGFSDGVDPDEHTTFTGSSPNTITGSIRLYNDNGAGQPAYWVADKVGAFGQAPELRVEGRAGLSGVSSLQITANALGGEGAVDDDATVLYLGAEGVLNIDAGVDEGIGEGNLWIDLEGTGTFTEIATGTYNNSEDWIIGEGTVTVGVPSSLVITEIDYTSDAQLTLTWTSTPGKIYSVTFSTDMINWDFDLDDGVVGDEGATTTRDFDLSEIPALDGQAAVFFRVEE